MTALSRELVAEQAERLRELDKAIKEQDKRLGRLSQADALSQRMLAVPGVGPITSTIVAADIEDGKSYAGSRDYAASLGLVPRQHSSGDKLRYLGISKRGNRYIGTKLIHGARAVVKNCAGKTDQLSRWLQALVERRGFNKACGVPSQQKRPDTMGYGYEKRSLSRGACLTRASGRCFLNPIPLRFFRNRFNG